ncbi:hypothetical protein [Paenibacillus sedimenti]|uniref:DUF3995 domain-containing protein n=1 Tax=Paenibacillus sedimenti TaxID=2770274 RepID=A0A926KWA0_9BACL|nr:hypothetical protein [Paenibacillus sedimenti]MBD0383294.1 hypothetical protein [Paenibacillus sedimenti]
MKYVVKKVLSGYGALLWSFVYGGLGLFWLMGGAGFPYGKGDPYGVDISMFAQVQKEEGALVIVVAGIIGVITALIIIGFWKRRLIPRRMPLLVAWSFAIILLCVVCDYRVLALIAYTLLLKFEFVDWPAVNQFICLTGGILWGSAAITYNKKAQEVCDKCGRTTKVSKWLQPITVAKWGKWATYTAVCLPLIYSLTRWAWAFGIPLGVSKQFLIEGERDTPGIWLFGAALGTVGAMGAVLTLGLISRWGEIFPHWFPFIHGKRVPPALAIIPATFISIVVVITGLMYNRLWLKGAFPEGNIATYAPELTWPIWGLALGAATLAYYLRRREQCQECGGA